MTTLIIPDELNRALEERAKREGRPATDIALDALATWLKSPKKPTRDLSAIAGSMTEEDARAIEENVRWMDEGDLAARQ
ncbi:MAG TPA: hypothetical protein VGN88_13440 [Phycisphaerae bacterium]|jgi:plasmid stability protein